ncbi:hypothetical protein GPALN_013156 [Globodera pallida]|nr:hypothetical protein GPALN_013156 [Globodera pallida]
MQKLALWDKSINFKFGCNREITSFMQMSCQSSGEDVIVPLLFIDAGPVPELAKRRPSNLLKKETEQQILALNVLNCRVLKVQGQIEDEKTDQQIVAESLNKFGRIDVLINNAACVTKPGNEDPLDIANWTIFIP